MEGHTGGLGRRADAGGNPGLDSSEQVSELKQEINDLRAQVEARERFVSAVVHDLRGPLSTAKMCAQLLKGDPETSIHQVELATIIERDVNRAERMICDLLDAARIRAGAALPMVIRECDLKTVAADVVSELSALHGDRFLLRGSESVRGYWSAGDLRRALWNLMTNAIKYGAEGAPITVTVTKEPSRAVVQVHNHGAPIPPELQTALFEPFNRLYKARTGSRAGWGLGLTLVRGFVAAQGGTVFVHSAAGAGTTFAFELPFDAREVDGFVEAPPSSHHRAY